MEMAGKIKSSKVKNNIERWKDKMELKLSVWLPNS